MSNVKITGQQYVVCNTTEARGGVHYQRRKGGQIAINTGAGYRQAISTTKIVDNAEHVAAAQTIYSAAHSAIKRRAIMTSIGYMTDADSVALLQQDFARLREEAATHNEAGRKLSGEARYVHVGFVPIRLEIDNAAAAKEIERTIRRKLTTLVDASEIADAADRLREFKLARRSCKNLEALVSGMLKFSVCDALACAKAAQTELLRALKETREPDLNLGAIHAALGLLVDFDGEEAAA